MKAPDKIYILTLDNGARFVESVKIKDDCDEYIRKDTLLEWAEYQIKHARDKETIPDNEMACYDSGKIDTLCKLIDKINSL